VELDAGSRGAGEVAGRHAAAHASVQASARRRCRAAVERVAGGTTSMVPRSAMGRERSRALVRSCDPWSRGTAMGRRIVAFTDTVTFS
jgi:hypothetical protein